ncbi:MAG: phosphatidylserine decarboxylase [Gammaproteobacteria bacterium]|nr:phosphatidylserine decarboxylase [Gammaproteobacteria bacterium]
MSKLFSLIQYVLPHHFLSRLVGILAEGKFAKNILIGLFIRKYKVDLSEAQNEVIEDYQNFNAFFIRKLKENARPISDNPSIIISPADGKLVAAGKIKGTQLIQAKNHYFSSQDLLGGDNTLADTFINGNFVTVYLSPRDYHRVHMPLKGKLLKTIHIPGRLFSVGDVTSSNIPNLFARNERLVCVFETNRGLCCLILVGAMIVGSIRTVWPMGTNRSHSATKIQRIDYTSQEMQVNLEKGEEVGHFELGSTVIVLFEAGLLEFNSDILVNTPIKMGESLGRIVDKGNH